jgi:hypothetical protein
MGAESRLYKGRVLYNGQEYASPYPPIVDADLWADAQQAVAVRRDQYGINRRKASNSHLLTGLLRCGYCAGRRDSGAVAPYRISPNYIVAKNKTWARSASGKGYARASYLCYRCQTKYKHHASSCPDSISINAAHIEQWVRDYIGELATADYVGKLEAKDRREALLKQIAVTTDRLEKVKGRHARALTMFADGKIEAPELEGILTKTKANIRGIERELAELRDEAQDGEARETEMALTALEAWDRMMFTEKKTAISKIIKEIRVYRDHIQVASRRK